MTSAPTDIATIAGLAELWAETFGDSRICIAILDGPVDKYHPSLAKANLTAIETLASKSADAGPASQHGTHIASVIFGHHNEPIKGLAPFCRGLVVPIFRDTGVGSIFQCSQLDLARAIKQAVQAGAHIINISGGQLSASGIAHPLLSDAVRYCAANGVLIVAAVGNEGCECLHIPGALPSVLAVGAMNSQGTPLDFSNWSTSYQANGILAPGENILGARSGGGMVCESGTSYATAIVSGVAGLLKSLQLMLGQSANPQAVRAAILGSALGRSNQPLTDCNPFLAGRLNVRGAMSLIIKGADSMINSETESVGVIENSRIESLPGDIPTCGIQAAGVESEAYQPPAESIEPGVAPSKCGCSNNPCTCGSGCGTLQLVYALGQLGYDFGTEARRDSITQHMDQPANPYDPNQLLAYLTRNPSDASSIIWTLSLDSTPIYAIGAEGAYARDVYDRLREFLYEQTKGEVERISVPGYISSSSRLSNGQVVPIIWAQLRGMYSWNTAALVEAASGAPPSRGAGQKDKDAYSRKKQDIANFLLRIYDELRNLGITSQERAMNYAATNALLVAEVFRDAVMQAMELDTIEVERSPICRAESDCWDVKLTFFNPAKVFEQARKVYRLTIDVSDVVPVMVGNVRSWFVR